MPLADAPGVTVVALTVNGYGAGLVTLPVGPFDEFDVDTRTAALVARINISITCTVRIAVGYVASRDGRPVATATCRVGFDLIPEI
jgi:hypothetical protein